MTTVCITLASVLGVFFFGIERVKNILIGYGQSALERKEKKLHLFYLNRLRDAIFRKDIYGIEAAFLRITIKELLTRKYPSPTGYLKKSFPLFKKHKRHLNILQSLLLIIVVFAICISLYDQLSAEEINYLNLRILVIFDSVLIIAIYYSIFKPTGIEELEIKTCKNLYKELKYAKSFLNDLKDICNTDYVINKEGMNLDRKLSILRGFIPRQLCVDKKFALKGGALHPGFPINNTGICNSSNIKDAIKHDTNIIHSDVSISIIIPIYNVEEKYLKECMHSVLNQTKKDIQIICINDGSTNNSSAVIQKYKEKDNRIEIIENKSNKGAGNARNAALQHVEGDYILFVDADDWIEHDACEKLYNLGEKTKAQLVQFLFEVKDQRKQANIHFEEHIRHGFYQENFQYKNNILTNKISILTTLQVWNKLWLTSFIRANKLRFDDTARAGEDMTMSWLAILSAKRIAVLPEKLYYYRCRDNSLSRKKEYYADTISNYDKIHDILVKFNLYENLEYKHFYLSKKLEYYYRYSQKVSSKKDRKEYRKIFLNSLTDDIRNYYYYELFKEHWLKYL
jgi:glycosyltransferase involved in cell wall biosynthesis